MILLVTLFLIAAMLAVAEWGPSLVRAWVRRHRGQDPTAISQAQRERALWARSAYDHEREPSMEARIIAVRTRRRRRSA